MVYNDWDLHSFVQMLVYKYLFYERGPHVLKGSS
jgi:hypothetical protein